MEAYTAARNSISGFTGLEVVFYALVWPSEPVDKASRAIQRPYRPKYGKNHRLGGANGQAESRNMGATRFSTQRPRLSIRHPINYGVYLAPLRSRLPELLPLGHCKGRQTYKLSHHRDTRHAFFQNSTEFFWNFNIAISFPFSESLVGQWDCLFSQTKPT